MPDSTTRTKLRRPFSRCLAISVGFALQMILLGSVRMARAETTGGSITIVAPLFSRGLVQRIDGSKRPKCPLPAGAAAAGLAGNVTLRLEVITSGQVRSAVVTRSSGHALLDEAARLWVQHVWSYPKAAEVQSLQEVVSFRPDAAQLRAERSRALAASRVIPETPRPPYLYVAMKTGMEGRVGLELSVDGGGKVQRAKVTKSSGHVLLDRVTETWAKSYWEIPHLRDQTNIPFVVVYQLR